MHGIVQLARLSDDDMTAVNNLEYLGVQVAKKQASGVEKFALKFGARKVTPCSCRLIWRTFMFKYWILSKGFSNSNQSRVKQELSTTSCHVQNKRPARRAREQDEESWQLSRFYPLIQVCNLFLATLVRQSCHWGENDNVALVLWNPILQCPSYINKILSI